MENGRGGRESLACIHVWLYKYRSFIYNKIAALPFASPFSQSSGKAALS